MGKSVYDLNLRVTFYARVSSSTEEQHNSLKNQIAYFKEFISKQPNWTFVDGYIDHGISGLDTKHREQFNNMIEDGTHGKFDLILTKEISRFARSTIDSIFYTSELLKHGVGVLFQNDNINTLYSDSELRLTIMSSIAQEESRKLSDRVKWGHKRAINSGRVLGNERIWGYYKEDGKLTINEEEATMVRLIFDLYAGGKGIRLVTDELNRLGYVNHNGKPFSFSTIRGILGNIKYKGYYCGNKVTTVDFRTKEKKHLDRADWITYKDIEGVPPIVSEETWDTANQILSQRSQKMSAKDKTSYQNKFLYSGKIICNEHNVSYWHNVFKYDDCEKEIWQCKKYRKHGKAACSSPAIYTHELNEILRNILHELFSNKTTYMTKIMAVYEKIIDGINYDNDIKQALGKIEQVKKKKEKLLDLSLNDMISNLEFKNRNDEYNLQIKDFEDQIEKYNKLNLSKYNNKDKLIQLKNALDIKVDFSKKLNEDVANILLERIEVFGGTENKIDLNIVLKSGVEVPSIYVRSDKKDMRLLHSIHMISNKRMCNFERNVNNIMQKSNTIHFNVNVFLNIA
jgi:DNA invertase Pin-like site-specific DNA recombinase